MSNVKLEIAGHSFTIACAEGEEDHVLGLGRMIHDKLVEMPNISAQNEARMLLFASLLLADELHEARQPKAEEKPPASPGLPLDEMPDLPQQLEKLAHTFENLAALLER